MKRAALSLLLALLPGVAASEPAPQVLTWDEAVQEALKRSSDLLSSRLGVDVGRALYRGSFNGVLPHLSLSNSYNDSKTSDGSSRWQASATAGIDLINFSEIARIRSASADLDQAEAALRQTSATLRASLRRAYAQVLYAETNMAVVERVRTIRERNARLVTLKYETGRESKGNMLRSRAQLLQAEADAAQARRDLRAAEAELSRRLGRDDFSLVAATGTFVTLTPPARESLDFAAIAATRPDVRAQAAAVRASEAGLSQARSALFPTLSVDYTRSRTDRTEFPARRYNWSVAGVLSLPLFSGGPTATYYDTKAARGSLERSRQVLRGAVQAAVADLEAAWADFAGSYAQVGVRQALLEAARQRNDEADIRYSSGLMSYDAWEIIVSDRVSNERQAVQAALDAVDSEAGWELALGKGLGE